MTVGEILLTAVVASLVFGPKQIPTLARHLGRLLGRVNVVKQQIDTFLNTQALEDQLLQNQKKAAEADNQYHKEQIS